MTTAAAPVVPGYDRCWNCGKPGIPGAVVYECPECEVRWSAVRGHDVPAVTEIAFMGDVFPAVDFTLPSALPSPA